MKRDVRRGRVVLIGVGEDILNRLLLDMICRRSFWEGVWIRDSRGAGWLYLSSREVFVRCYNPRARESVIHKLVEGSGPSVCNPRSKKI